MGIVHDNRRTIDYLACGEDEHPIGFQLFGADPAALARAAEVCVAAGADLVDLNMACPVRKVVKTGAGAALLGAPETAEAVVRAVVAAVPATVPVTVKIRSGLRERRRGGAPAGAPPRRRRRGRDLHPPAHGRPALSRPRRPPCHGGSGGRAARPRDRLRRRRRPRGRPRPARRRRGRRHARPPRRRSPVALPRDPATTRRRRTPTSGSRKCAASPMRCSPTWGRARSATCASSGPGSAAAAPSTRRSPPTS